MSKRLVKLLLAATVLLVVGCGDQTDDKTLQIAESLAIADLEIETGTRLTRSAVAGRPDAGLPTYTRIGQTYAPNGDDPQAVVEELRRLVEAEEWVINSEDEAGFWTTAERTIDGRTFSVRTGFNPRDGIVSLWIEESRRNAGTG